MPDEKRLFAKLGSWVYGSMIHITHVIGHAFEADLSALMLHNLGNHPYRSHVHLMGRGLSHQEDIQCQQWASDPQGLFAQVRRHGRKLSTYSVDSFGKHLREQGVSSHDMPRVYVTTTLNRLAPGIAAGKRAQRPDGLVSGPGSGPASGSAASSQASQPSRERLDGSDLNFFELLEELCPVRQGLCMNMTVQGDIWATAAVLYRDPARSFSEQETQCFEHIKPVVAHMLRSSCARQGLISPAAGSPGQGQAPQQQLTLHEILSRLTRAERQVLGYLRLSATEKEISQQIYRSPHTVHVHVKNIYRKLDVRSRAELLQLFGDSLKD